MSTITKPICEFCADSFVMTVAGYDMVCPTHPELHDAGLARVSVETAAEIGSRIAADRGGMRSEMTAATLMFVPFAAGVMFVGLLILARLVGAW